MEQIQTLTRRLTLQEHAANAAAESARISAENAADRAKGERESTLTWLTTYIPKVLGSEIDIEHRIERDDHIEIDGIRFGREQSGDGYFLTAGFPTECGRHKSFEWRRTYGLTDLHALFTKKSRQCKECCDEQARSEGYCPTTYVSTAERLESIIREIVREELEAGQ